MNPVVLDWNQNYQYEHMVFNICVDEQSQQVWERKERGGGVSIYICIS